MNAEQYIATKFVRDHAAPGLSEQELAIAFHSARDYFCYEGTDDNEEFGLIFRMWHALNGEPLPERETTPSA